MTPKPKAAVPLSTVDMLRPTPTVDAELEWLFHRLESGGGIPSNFHAGLNPRLPDVDAVTPEEAAEAARAQRTILGWLRAIPDAEAGVLQAAYEPRVWPARLADELGRITGVVVRLACALDPWPHDRDAQRFVERARAEWLASHATTARKDATLVRLRREAEMRFAKAHHAYSVVRGHGPCLARSS
jgi:hypothetical protein